MSIWRRIDEGEQRTVLLDQAFQGTVEAQNERGEREGSRWCVVQIVINVFLNKVWRSKTRPRFEGRGAAVPLMEETRR